MQVKLAHSKYQTLIQTSDETKLISSNSEMPLFGTTILDSGVTLSESTIHVVLQVNDKTLIHWYGNEELKSQEIELNKIPVHGLQLVTDSSGGVHLFYLQQQVGEAGYTLFHHRFIDGQWDDAIRVSANLSSNREHWQVSYGLDEYLHLVYLNQQRDVILYRGFDLETNLWSGAISLVKEECDKPQLYSTSKGLVLMWVSRTENKKSIKAMIQDGKWSTSHSLIELTEDIFRPLIELTADSLTVGWQVGGKYWSTSYDQQWSPPKATDISNYESNYETIMAHEGKGCSVWAVYQQKKSTPAEIPSAEISKTASVKERTAPAQSEESQAQKQAEHRFFQEAFQLHQEWEKMKLKYQQFEELLTNLAKEKVNTPDSKIEKSVKQLNEDVDLINERISVIRTDVRRLRSRSEPTLQRPAEKKSDIQLQTLEQKISRLEATILRLERNSAQVKPIKLEQQIKRRSLLKRIISRI